MDALERALEEHRPVTSTTVRVEEDDLACLVQERNALRKQRDALQARMSEMVNNTLARRVRAFHVKFGHPVEHTPHVPDDATVRFRLKLITEEFFELVNACVDAEDASADAPTREAALLLKQVIGECQLRVDLPEVYDALLDLAYVIEGTHAAFGTLAEPGMAEVQRANMAKDAVYVEAKDGFKKGINVKPTKPAGWTPPDIQGVLIAQGWKP